MKPVSSTNDKSSKRHLSCKAYGVMLNAYLCAKQAPDTPDAQFLGFKVFITNYNKDLN